MSSALTLQQANLPSLWLGSAWWPQNTVLTWLTHTSNPKGKGKKNAKQVSSPPIFSPCCAAVNQPWRIMSGSASPGRRALCTYSVWKKSLWVTLQTISELCLVFLGWHNKRKISFSEGLHPEGYQMVPGSGMLNRSHCWPHPTSDTPPLSRNATASPHAVTVDAALSMFAPDQFSVCCLD